MQKTFLKFVAYELIERMVRLDRLLADCAEEPAKVSPAMTGALQRQSDALKTYVLADQAFLNELFTDTPIPDNSMRHWLKDEFGAHYETLRRMAATLNPLYKGALLPETFLFLKDALGEELCNGHGELAVITTPEGSVDPVHGLPMDDVLVSGLPLLQRNNPLGWTLLVRALAERIGKDAQPLAAVRGRVKKALNSDDALTDALLTHSLALRLMGPAYYFASLADAVFQKDAAFLNWIEPALFVGLNHLGMTAKSLVILHEGAERSKTTLLKCWGDDEDGVVDKDMITALFNAVEKTIPDKYAFVQKHFERSLALQEGLAQGTLLASSPLYPQEEVAQYLDDVRRNDEFSIYEALARVTEYPHTPREVVNAGWVHKMERAPVWLYAAVAVQGQGYDGFERLQEMVDGYDSLLQKSIETSEVHRILLCTA